jgi:hypothetical protein
MVPGTHSKVERHHVGRASKPLGLDVPPQTGLAMLNSPRTTIDSLFAQAIGWRQRSDCLCAVALTTRMLALYRMNFFDSAGL